MRGLPPEPIEELPVIGPVHDLKPKEDRGRESVLYQVIRGASPEVLIGLHELAVNIEDIQAGANHISITMEQVLAAEAIICASMGAGLKGSYLTVQSLEDPTQINFMPLNGDQPLIGRIKDGKLILLDGATTVSSTPLRAKNLNHVHGRIEYPSDTPLITTPEQLRRAMTQLVKNQVPTLTISGFSGLGKSTLVKTIKSLLDDLHVVMRTIHNDDFLGTTRGTPFRAHKDHLGTEHIRVARNLYGLVDEAILEAFFLQLTQGRSISITAPRVYTREASGPIIKEATHHFPGTNGRSSVIAAEGTDAPGLMTRVNMLRDFFALPELPVHVLEIMPHLSSDIRDIVKTSIQRAISRGRGDKAALERGEPWIGEVVAWAQAVHYKAIQRILDGTSPGHLVLSSAY